MSNKLSVLKKGCINLNAWFFAKATVAVMAMFSAVSANSTTIGDLGTNAAANAKGLAAGALQLGAFAGVVMVIIAFIKGRTAKQNGEGIGTYVVMGIVGALLFSVPTLIGIFGTSIIGSDDSGSLKNALGM